MYDFIFWTFLGLVTFLGIAFHQFLSVVPVFGLVVG
jgi:hypothetical protein